MDDDGGDDERDVVMCPKSCCSGKKNWSNLELFIKFAYSTNSTHPWAALVVGVFGAELDGDDDCDEDVLVVAVKQKNIKRLNNIVWGGEMKKVIYRTFVTWAGDILRKWLATPAWCDAARRW